MVLRSIENLALVVHPEGVRLRGDQREEGLEADLEVAVPLLLEALVELARVHKTKMRVRRCEVVVQCSVVVACLHMPEREMAARPVPEHSGSTTVLPTWAEHTAKPHAVLVVVVGAQNQRVAMEHRDLLQTGMHSTGEATSYEEVPEVGPWGEVEVSVVPAAVLEVARCSLAAGWGTANLQG